MKFGLVMIVKNERARIGPTLESLRPHLSAWTILDTGSTDGTQELVRERLVDIPGRLLEGPFVDFGSARSRAFAAARWTADWLLASDADMLWSIDRSFRPASDVDAYLVDMGSAGFVNRLPLVLRGNRAWQSVGAVHEYTVLDNHQLGRRVPTDEVRIAHPGAAWSAERGRWHAELLEAERHREPRNPRTMFYLGQTYRDLGDDRARALYLERVLAGDAGHPQERFVAAWQAAALQSDWRLRVLELLAAWEMRPTRLEPLYDAVHALNEHGAWRAAYQLAQARIEPCTDDLFVHGAVWDWGLKLERSIAAFHVGALNEWRALTAELTANPRVPTAARSSLLLSEVA